MDEFFKQKVIPYLLPQDTLAILEELTFFNGGEFQTTDTRYKSIIKKNEGSVEFIEILLTNQVWQGWLAGLLFV